MKFHSYEDSYQLAKKSAILRRMRVESNYSKYYLKRITEFDYMELEHYAQKIDMAEYEWYNQYRPYYNVWPSFTNCLTKLKLDKPGPMFNLSPGCISINFSVGNEFLAENKIKSILCHCAQSTNTGGKILFIAPQHTNETFGNICIRLSVPDKSMEQIIEGPGVGTLTYRISDLLRLILTVWLLKDDPQFLSPDFSQKNLTWTYDEWKAQGRRRGITGWNLGQQWEAIPHFRRPHLGLRWTGPGGSIPKIVPVRGSVIHRSKVSEVPTGYLGDGSDSKSHS